MKKLVVLLAALLLATPAVAKDVNLAWDASPTEGVVGYKICYTTIEGLLVEGQDVPTEGILPTCVDAGGALSLLIPGLVDETPYYFGSVAYNDVTQQSKLSNIVMSPGFLIPDPPANLRGTSTVNNVPVPITP